MNTVRIEAEGAKGRKDQDEGRGGRKGENLSDDELPEELGQEEEDAAKKEKDEEPGCVGGEGAEGVPGCIEFEVRKPRIARRPLLPTKAEIDEH